MSSGRAAGSAGQSYDGLFPPDTVTWRLHTEPILWVAGLRAVLLQATHPAAMAGVLQHSDFRADPWRRLFRTADYVATVVYGSRAEVEQAGARLRGIHRTVRGIDPVTGHGYRADDPQLLRWVHCCEVESFLTVARRAGVPLSDADADRYYAEQRRAAEVVGLDPARVPGSQAEMAAYFDAVRPRLRVDRRVREIALFVVAPPMPTWLQLLTPARPAWAAIGALAFASLPRWCRRMYAAPGLSLADPLVTGQLRLLRGALGLLPDSLHEGPHLRDARARAGLTESVAVAAPG